MSVFFNIQEQATKMLEILNSLLDTKDRYSMVSKTLECESGFIIHRIPSNHHHPLKDIVNIINKPFFFVSKLTEIENDDNDENISRDEEISHHSIVLPEIPVITKQRVLVGTPIPQSVHHLFWQKNFHESGLLETLKFLDISQLKCLKICDCRYLASIYTQCLKQQENLPEIWFLCNQEGPQQVSYLGVLPQGIHPVNRQEISLAMTRSEEYDSEISGKMLNDLKKRHMSLHHADQVETHAYAIYNLYGDMEGKSEMTQSFISMVFAWDSVHEVLQSPPLSSNAIVHIYANPEDVQAILPDITEELHKLSKLFFKTKQNTLGDCQVDFDQEELRQKVLKFLDKLRLQSLGEQPKEQQNPCENVATTLNVEFNISKRLNRQNMEGEAILDDTESLWLFFKDLQSTHEMMFSLEVIFEQIFQNNYQPVLDVNNQTQIACVMKEIMSCATEKERAGLKRRVQDLCVELQAIVDIGIEKIQNDYINFFINQSLTTKDLLEYFTAKNIHESERLQRLLKLHCVLTLVTIAISYARISHDELRKMVPAALKFYENHAHTDIPVYSLSLPAFSCSSASVKMTCIRQFQPHTWVAAMTSNNDCVTMIQLQAKDSSGSLSEDEILGEQNKYNCITATSHKVLIR